EVWLSWRERRLGANDGAHGAAGEQAVLLQQRGQGDAAQAGAGVVEEVAAVEQPATGNGWDGLGHGASGLGGFYHVAPREGQQNWGRAGADHPDSLTAVGRSCTAT